MESLLIWPQNPAASILVLVLVAQIVLWAARKPIHQALHAIGGALAGALRIASHWCRNVATDLTHRNREVLLEAGRTETEKKIEREFVRLHSGFAKELTQYPKLHQKLDACTSQLEADCEASAEAPPAAPGWPEAVQAVAAVPDVGDRAGNKILDELRKTAVSSEKKALKEYREARDRRHKILHGMAPVLKEVKQAGAQTLRAVEAALGTASKIDGYMERYEKIRAGDEPTERLLAASALTLFIVSAIAVSIALGGAFVNFQLIALPMSELVPAGSRVFGIPVASIAALVIVLMEAAAGLFVMEALGVTELFPRVGRLEVGKRRLILAVAFTALFLLAAIESSLAILREHIVEADMLLKASLAGSATDAAVAAPAASMIPVVGQAVLGFILPWILAMIALPLETLVQSGRHVGGRVAAFGAGASATLLRILAHGCRKLGIALTALFDITIILPLQLERLIRRPKRDTEPVRRELPVRHEVTGEHGVAS